LIPLKTTSNNCEIGIILAYTYNKVYCNFANKWGAFFAFLYNGGERSEPVFLKMVWGCIIEMRFD
jgi:hypothetical protein